MTARSSVPTTAAVPVPAASRSPGGTRCLMHAAVAVIMMSAVCGIARAQGVWSTARLSGARSSLQAASVGNVAIFIGSVLCVACVCAASDCRLMRATAESVFNAVDLYNCATGAWSTARLSVARSGLKAASVGNVAIFAGGEVRIGNVLLLIEGELWE
jgi:hypothetical protein